MGLKQLKNIIFFNKPHEVRILAQQATDKQIKKILPIVELKKVVKYNKLSENFIRNNIEPLIEMQDSDDDDTLTISDVYKIQRYNFKNEEKKNKT